MGEVISVFEYDLLGSDKAASVGAKLVPPLVFNYLEALSLASNQGSQFLKLTSRSGFKLLQVKWSTKTGHRVRVFSSIDFPIRLVVTHHYIRAVLVRCNIQRYSPLLRELHR